MLSRTLAVLRHRVLYMGSSGISESALAQLIDDYTSAKTVCTELMVVTPPRTRQGETGAARLARARGVRHEEVNHSKTLREWRVPLTDAQMLRMASQLSAVGGGAAAHVGGAPLDASRVGIRTDVGDAAEAPPPPGGGGRGEAPAGGAAKPDPALGWDIGVVVSFRYFIPPRVIRKFRLGVINLHPSLLPKYRGSSPVQAALFNNDSVGGVSIIKIQPREIMDTGDILAAAETPLSPTMTFDAYLNVVSGIGADLIYTCLLDFETRWAQAVPQPNKQLLPADDPTFAGILSKGDHQVTLKHMSAATVYNRWRGLHGAGGTYCTFKRPRDGACLRCHFIHLRPLTPHDHAVLAGFPDAAGTAPGAVVFPQKNCSVFYLKAAGEEWVGVADVHISCEKPKNAREFLSGYRFKPLTVYPGVFE